MSPAGSASKGLYRVHQFSKVEMFVLCTPQQSEALLQELCDLEEEMFTDLGLHFKILVNCLPMHGLFLAVDGPCIFVHENQIPA